MRTYQSRLNRRSFIQKAAAGTAAVSAMIVPRHVLGGLGQTPPSERVNVAGIGVGNRGWTVIRQMEAHNVVALCDVDSKYLAPASEHFTSAEDVPRFPQDARSGGQETLTR